MSQFAFLNAEFPEVFAHAAKAEVLARSEPRGACFYARLALEVAVNWLYHSDGSLREPYEQTLAARIFEPTFRQLAGSPIVAKARIVKDLGNIACHETKAVAPASAISALRELFHITYWLAHTYSRKGRPDRGLVFLPEALPLTRQISVSSVGQLQEAANQFRAAVKARDEAQQQRAASEDLRSKLEAELAALHAEIAAAKAANAAVTDTHDYDEAATRDTFIDLLLHEAGWSLDEEADREFPVTGMPNAKGEGVVDYVLWGNDGKPLGLVEAKRTRRDARDGQQQAKLYADCLEQMFGQRPIIFYSNGYDHWIWDDSRYAPRVVQGFLTKDELALAVQRRGTRKPLLDQEVDGTIVERFYQRRAIRRVVESFEGDNLRKALLVMATGAGKTRTVIALCDLLMRSNWVRRVLFLADRLALVRQAINAFKRHLPSASPVNLVTERDAEGRVYVSTYPTMMGLIDEITDGTRRVGVGHFDLVIIDEAHRSVYRKYAAIFEYFDSLLVGLTATPKDEVDRDTYRLFELERGVPTDAYSLDEAVEDGYLVRPEAVSVPLKFVREGIKYDDLSDDDKARWDEIDWSETDPPPSQVDAGAINRWLFNDDTVDKALEYLMTRGLRVAAGDRLGKTIIFAKNHDHAQFIVRRFDANYPHLGGSFARVIDFKTEYAASLIDDFSIAEKPPHIAVSVDMLDTGIDIPEILNLVFFKIIRSKTKFWQMIGRGTRLCPNLFAPGVDKEFFYVFDFCMNFEFFNLNPKLTDGVIADSLAKQLFTARVDLIGEIHEGHGTESSDDALHTVAEDTSARLREEVAAMTLDNFLVRPKRRFVEKYAEPAAWETLEGDKRTELVQDVAGLPSGLVDDDVEAKKFDLLMLRAQLALLRSDARFATFRKQILELASALESLSNVPMVQAELELILESQTDAYWQDVTVPILETARRRLRSLVKLVDIQKQPIIYTAFDDEIGVGTAVLVAGVPIGADMGRFRAKARQFLKAHENHLAILKLRRNEQLTTTDLAELERMFVEADVGGPEALARIRGEGGLGVFVRSLVGLDRVAAKAAFNAFITGRTLSASQLEFVNMIVDHLSDRGVVEPTLLYESPFTDIDPLGVAGVFPDPDVGEIVGILEAIRGRAAA